MRAGVEGMFGALGKALTYGYVIWFGTVSLPTRRILAGSLSFVTLSGAVLLLVEMAMEARKAGHLQIHVPAAVLLAAAAYLLWHRVEEFRSIRRKPEFMRRVNGLLREFAALRFTTRGAEQEELDDFVTHVLARFQEVFEDVRGLHLTVMLPEPDGSLTVRYQYPVGTRYNPLLRLNDGKGAAGVAFRRSAMVYVPHIWFQHGVLISPRGEQIPESMVYEHLDSVYVRWDPEPFRAILCAPIRGESRVHGVLNLDTRKYNPFNEFDIQTAAVAASFLAMAMDRHQAVPSWRFTLPARRAESGAT